ncbi:hypothetical protein JCGZ_01369 [Jatropha curcas]|uniref:Rx N-terminal domain-containing protein n=1 Tax=Jatropha curcas TaxID=180498 RepID=A0A067LKK7_JATCU|nr:hypothetical protein JCGZ_01369 [Jatropha curcas]
MVEAVVSFAIERIADVLVREASSLSDVRDKVEQLRTELKRIHCFLKDADNRQDKDERVRKWVAEIREIAYEAEDVTDTFLYAKALTGTRKGICRFIKRPFSIFIKVSYLHETETWIKSIQEKIRSISRSMQTYGIKLIFEGEASRRASEMRRFRRSYPHEEDDVIGLEFSTRQVLVGILMEVASKQDKFELVKMEEEKLLQLRLERMEDELDRMKEKRLFKLMLENMKVEDMFISMLEKMGEGKLVEEVSNVLKKKRYFVVLDDIWRSEDWDSSVKIGIVPNARASSPARARACAKARAWACVPLKVWKLCSKGVFKLHGPSLYLRSSPVEPDFLTDDEAWQLLSRKAFIEEIVAEYDYLSQFEKLGKEMVSKCGGLPLAIVVLGGVLATKKSLLEWKFPEDWEIHKRELIRMWIAEGFVSKGLIREEDETMEDLCEEYLEELVSRSMVQVSQKGCIGMGIKTCRIHDLMRDMCALMAREEDFLGISEHYKQNNTARRIAVHPQVSPEFVAREAASSKGFYAWVLVHTLDQKWFAQLETLRVDNLELGIEFVTCLQELKLTGMTKLTKRIRDRNGVTGEDFRKDT